MIAVIAVLVSGDGRCGRGGDGGRAGRDAVHREHQNQWRRLDDVVVPTRRSRAECECFRRRRRKSASFRRLAAACQHQFIYTTIEYPSKKPFVIIERANEQRPPASNGNSATLHWFLQLSFSWPAIVKH
ncbi:unnamed protein product [Heligmosomoides polygyrus]|uniref:Secreted protein n=1 Tax=Heligmosomoides polygyrus TaxID=6339 RepID=A0A183FVV1_HELPZ|nr:unnamed protein product [Heligmosomoides polygyrus]